LSEESHLAIKLDSAALKKMEESMVLPGQ